MIIQEVYVGRTKGIDDLFNEFKKFRQEYRLYRTIKNTRNIKTMEFMIEELWGFKAFSLNVDPSPQPNAYTYPVAMSIDIDPSEYIYTTSEGYKYRKQAHAAAISYITRGLLTNDSFSDEEVFAIFLHEIGHSFVHRSPMVASQQEVYKNTLIIQVLYQLFYSLIIFNPLGIAQAVQTILMSTNGYKLIKAEFNKLVKKIPVLRGLNITLELAVKTLFNSISNFMYLLMSITGIVALSNYLNKKTYDITTKKQISITGHPEAYGRSSERLSDDFATMYGFGPYISTALVKMESPDNQGAFMKITHSLPILGNILKKQDSLSMELNGLLGVHPSTPDRILSILGSMEDDLKKDKTLSPKIKAELAANIKTQKKIIDDLKREQPEIAKNKNEYMQFLTKVGLETGDSEDFLEKRYTDPEQLRKFYKERKVRREAAFLESIEIDIDSDPEVSHFII